MKTPFAAFDKRNRHLAAIAIVVLTSFLYSQCYVICHAATDSGSSAETSKTEHASKPKRNPEEERKQRQKEQEQRRKNAVKAEAERQAKSMREAEARLKAAEPNKDSDPAEYLAALIQLSVNLSYGHKDLTRNRKVLNEALSLFEKSPHNVAKESRRMFDGLENSIREKCLEPQESFDLIKRSLAAADKLDPKDENWSNSAVDAMNQLSKYSAQMRIELFQYWLNLCENDTSNQKTYLRTRVRHGLAWAIAEAGGADKGIKVLQSEVNDTSDGAPRFTKQINLAIFCVETNKLAEAETCWKDAMSKHKWEGYELHSLQFLLRAYNRKNLHEDSAKVVDGLLSMPSKVGFLVTDPILETDIQRMISAANLDGAEALVRKRLKAGESIEDSDPRAFWTLKLSDIYLATGRDKESKKLFDRALMILEKSGSATDAINNRNELMKQLGKSN